MRRLVTGQEMKALDEHTIKTLKIPATILMDHAGLAVAKSVQRYHPTHVCIACGRGNNGGDGWVAARWLRHFGVPTVEVVSIIEVSQLQGEALAAAEMAIAAGIGWSLFDPAHPLPPASIFVDALLGTGVTRPVEGKFALLIEALNSSGRPIIAVDVPSGIDADTGSVLGVAVRAAETVTMGCEKVGTAVTPGAMYAGEVRVADIGIAVEVPGQVDVPGQVEMPGPGIAGTSTAGKGTAGARGALGVGGAGGVADDGVRRPVAQAGVITRQDVQSWLPRRDPLSHKGTFGRVAIAMGDMRGAAILAASGAARSGAGLVVVATPDAGESQHGLEPGWVIRARSKEGTESDAWRRDCATIVLGPGLGSDGAKRGWLVDILEHQGTGVLDADALTHGLMGEWSRAAEEALLPPNRYVLTPHPKECGALIGRSADEVQQNRIEAAILAAKKFQSIVVLKGYRSVIATPDGTVRVNPTGNAALATAGTGDVLAGMIGGLLAQGLSPLEAACAGAYLHGRAGEIAGEKYGLASVIASDVVECISRAITEVSTSDD